MAKNRKEWVIQRKRDPYYKKAKKEGYRSRSVYKLKHINNKFRILKKGNKVLDIGAAPGGWIQYAVENVGNRGFVIGVDINVIEPLPYENVKLLQLDLRNTDSINIIYKETKKISFKKCDVILSDISPNIYGVWDVDVNRQIELCESVLEVTKKVLKRNGICVYKLFQGSETDVFLNKLRQTFFKVKIFRPIATRKKSSEIYIIGFGLR